MKFSVTKYGEPLDPSLYTWDLETKTFNALNEAHLVLDFSDLSDCNFITGSNCTFITKSFCNFNTGDNCFFNTFSDCNFDTGLGCTFDTSVKCNFITHQACTFTTGLGCTFETGRNCIAIIRLVFLMIDLSDYEKVELLDNNKIDFDGTIMTYEEYKYLELVKNI
jgi:hypothetical protein